MGRLSFARYSFLLLTIFGCRSVEKVTEPKAETLPIEQSSRPPATIYAAESNAPAEEFVATARGGCKKGVRCGRSCIAKGRTCRISKRDQGGCKKGYECGNACIAADKRCRLYEDEISPELAGERSQAERVSEYKKHRAERKGKVCKKGCPCGNSCIPCEKVCRK